MISVFFGNVYKGIMNIIGGKTEKRVDILKKCVRIFKNCIKALSRVVEGTAR